jgi:GxxExxY protein
MTENETGTVIVDAAFTVFGELGSSLLESVYEAALAHELRERGLFVVRQAMIPVVYRGMTLEEGFRADLVVEKKVLVELKSVERLLPVH